MKKPVATKQLALYSVVCAGLCFLLQSTAAMLPGQFINLFERTSTMELAMQWKLLLIGMSAVSVLPMAAIGIWSLLTKEITRSRAMMTVVLTPVLYVAGMIVNSGMRALSLRMVVGTGSDSVLAFSTAMSSMQLFTLLNTAALVLVCCAGAIELYLTTHSPSDGV